MIEPKDQVKEISVLKTGMKSYLGGNASGRSGHRSHGSDQERLNRRSRCSSSTSQSSSSASRRHRSHKKRTPRRRERRSSSSRSRSRSGRQGSREEQRERRSCRRRKERRACSKMSSRSSSETRLSESRSSRRHQPRNDDSGKLEGDAYKFQEPSRTIMIRGLALHLTENDIRADFQEFGMTPRDVRVIRDRDSGAARGFAFVDFYTLPDAVRWIEMKKGVLILQDRYRSSLVFSKSSPKTSGFVADWICSLCQGINFKRRSNCYKCNEPRPAEDVPLNKLPTNTLVLENLDVLTTEETVLQSIQSRRAISTISIMAVKILRDSTTKISEGVCHLKTHCISDAEKIYECFQVDPLKIDGRDVYVKCSPYEQAPENVNKNLATDALGASRWSNRLSTQEFNSAIQYSASGEINVEALSQASARMYAGTMDEYTTYVQFYRKYYAEQKTNGTLGNIDGLGGTPAPGYAMNVFNPGSASSSEFKNISNNSSTFPGVSGTELANDKVKSASQSRAKPPSLTRDSMEQEPTRITNEIDKWMNRSRKKQQKSKQISAPFSSKGFPLLTSTKLNQSKTGSRKHKEQDYGSTVKPSLETNQNQNGTTSASPASSLIDQVSLSCLLCKRRFRSKEVLLKHAQISEMHLRNLKDLALVAAT